MRNYSVRDELSDGVDIILSYCRMVKEVDDVLCGRSYVTTDDITQLSYTHQVIKETLRLHPPVPVIFRRIAEQTTLSGYSIPENTPCMVSQPRT